MLPVIDRSSPADFFSLSLPPPPYPTMRICIPFSLLFLFLSTTISYTYGFNITRILAKHPAFSTFNHYLTVTHLATEINRRKTITVCALDNPTMSELLSRNPSIAIVKNVLSFHVLVDYFGTKKLHQLRDGSALVTTLFQATGLAPGSSGFVNITDVEGGKVAFGPKDNGGDLDVFYVKSLEEIPYDISIIQISKVLPSDVAAAPTPEPSAVNITDIMSAHGCKVFSDTLIANPEALKTYRGSIDGGLTVFCPIDDPFKAFLPKFKNLTAADKLSFLEFFAVPVYESVATLKSSNGIQNTLATDGEKKFDFMVQNDGEDVTLKTRSTTAKILDTLIDEQPLAIHTIDKVLLPKELFKAAAAPAPASDTGLADAPKPSKSKTKKHPSSDGATADSPDDAPADDVTADDNAGVRFGGGRLVVVVLSFCLGHLLLFFPRN